MFETATKFTDRSEAEYCADCNIRSEEAEESGWSYKVRCIQHNPRRYVVAVYDEEGRHVGEL